MCFKVSCRKNPETGNSEGYYRLIESYRNTDDRICHRTLLNIGFLDKPVDIDRPNQVRRILSKRYRDTVGDSELFDIKTDNHPVVNQLVEELWNKPASENRIDIQVKKNQKSQQFANAIWFLRKVSAIQTFAKSVRNGFAGKFLISCNFLIIFQILVSWKKKPAR